MWISSLISVVGFFFYKDLLFNLKLLVHVFDDTILKETILLNTLRNLVIG